MKTRLSALMFVSFFLAACGGGGEDSTSVLDSDKVRDSTGAAPPAESAGEQAARAPGIVSRADSLIISTSYMETTAEELPNLRLHARCTGTRCDLSSPSLGYLTTVRLSDLEFSLGSEVALGTKHGVTIIWFADSDEMGLGAWLHHSGFQVTDGADTFEDITVTARYAMAGGDLTGGRPMGNAIWRGLMVGMTATGPGRGERLQGDASLVYDLAARNLDIAFTRIQNLDRSRAHSTSSVRFDDVSVASGGTFEAGLSGNRVQGGFYGPRHAEAAGVFEQSNIVGAFGAKRQ